MREGMGYGDGASPSMRRRGGEHMRVWWCLDLGKRGGGEMAVGARCEEEVW
jgi:hypothetical protein